MVFKSDLNWHSEPMKRATNGYTWNSIKMKTNQKKNIEALKSNFQIFRRRRCQAIDGQVVFEECRSMHDKFYTKC